MEQKNSHELLKGDFKELLSMSQPFGAPDPILE